LNLEVDSRTNKGNPIARKNSNPLTNQKEITANQRGQITKYQQSRLSGVFWDKKQRWIGMVIFGIVPIIGPFIGAVWGFASGRSQIQAPGRRAVGCFGWFVQLVVFAFGVDVSTLALARAKPVTRSHCARDGYGILGAETAPPGT
jgi:hypothetical protein